MNPPQGVTEWVFLQPCVRVGWSARALRPQPGDARASGDVVANVDIWTMTAGWSAQTALVSGPTSETLPEW